VGRQQQDREIADPAGEICQEDQRGLVGHVDVVEHHDQPARLTGGPEQDDHGVEGALAGLGARQVVARRPLPAGRPVEQCLQPRGGRDCAGEKRPQDVQPRSEGDRAVAVQAVTPACGGARGSCVGGQGGSQAGLAHSRLARAQDEPPAPARSLGEPAPQRRHLLVPPHDQDGPDVTTGRPKHSTTLATHARR